MEWLRSTKEDRQSEYERREAARKARFGTSISRRKYVVQVVFCRVTDPIPDGPTYEYEWALTSLPSVGDRVFVRGGDGRPAEAAIKAVGASISKRRVLDLAPVYRLATDDDIRAAVADEERARERAEEDERSWLRMMRRAAGLPTPGRSRTKPPEGFPAVPPAAGSATPGDAGQHGRVWWRAYKRAEERGHDAEEVQAFRSIAHRWYAIRDKG